AIRARRWSILPCAADTSIGGSPAASLAASAASSGWSCATIGAKYSSTAFQRVSLAKVEAPSQSPAPSDRAASHRHNEIGVAGHAPSAVRLLAQDAHGVSRHGRGGWPPDVTIAPIRLRT